uniref:Secreted protein n=1 Tax=Heterorhabditis bacteriophora TaxID=37862 RepID=A0A1I7WBV0_HETBA
MLLTTGSNGSRTISKCLVLLSIYIWQLCPEAKCSVIPGKFAGDAEWMTASRDRWKALSKQLQVTIILIKNADSAGFRPSKLLTILK